LNCGFKHDDWSLMCRRRVPHHRPASRYLRSLGVSTWFRALPTHGYSDSTRFHCPSGDSPAISGRNHSSDGHSAAAGDRPCPNLGRSAVDKERIEELPVQSRNYLNFVLLAPGVSSSAQQPGRRSLAPLPDSGLHVRRSSRAQQQRDDRRAQRFDIREAVRGNADRVCWNL